MPKKQTRAAGAQPGKVSMIRTIRPRPLTSRAFAGFGDVLAIDGPPDRLINAGLCGRWHDRALLDFAQGGRAGLSLFDAVPQKLPYRFDLVERHPLGSQAFIPMTLNPFLVIVAPDAGRGPGEPLAFLTAPGQGINMFRGIWHGVLTPLSSPALFAVFDRIGEGANLEEFRYAEPWTVAAVQD